MWDKLQDHLQIIIQRRVDDGDKGMLYAKKGLHHRDHPVSMGEIASKFMTQAYLDVVLLINHSATGKPG